MRVLVWGTGNMASAFAKGLARGAAPLQFHCWNPSAPKAQALARELGGVVVSDHTQLPPVDVVVLGFKPQKLAEGARQLQGLAQDTLVISLLAAVPLEGLGRHFGERPLLRVMPNLAVANGDGVVLWQGQGLSPAELVRWQQVLSNMGLAPQLTEELIDLYTLHAGCSPAFLYQWIEDASRFAGEQGGDPALARQILIRAWQGALRGLESEGLSMEEKVSAVASKGGVTRAALDGFLAAAPDYIQRGFAAGLKRLKELR